MDVLPLPSVPPAQPSDGGAAVSATDDDATQAPALTFKALLAQLKALKAGRADSISTTPTDTAAEDMAASEASGAVPGADPALIASAAGLSPVIVPPPAAIELGGEAPATDSAGVVESQIRKPRTPDPLLGKLEAKSTLGDAQLTATELPAATNFAASGQNLPHAAATDSAPPTAPLSDSQPALHVTAALLQTRSTASGPQLAAFVNYAAPTAETNRSAAAVAMTDAQSAPQLTTALQQPLDAAAKATAQISTPVGTPAWSNELGQHLIWMVSHKQHVAELHLHPPHLGPLDIKLTIDDMQTTAVFTSPHGAVRDAIAAELPRLREVLADSGITLSNASVTADTPRHGSAFASQQPQRGVTPSVSAPTDILAPPDSAPVVQRIGLVDLFA